jgi:hypothetical protein
MYDCRGPKPDPGAHSCRLSHQPHAALLAHSPQLLSYCAHSDSSHESPSQPGSHWHTFGPIQTPRPRQLCTSVHVGVSHAAPDQPSTHTHEPAIQTLREGHDTAHE